MAGVRADEKGQDEMRLNWRVMASLMMVLALLVTSATAERARSKNSSNRAAS
jgi:hypothetical protein